MADAVKAEGLVIAYTDSTGKVYPLACAKDASINISRDVIELAPKSFNTFRRYIPGKRTFSINGTGLVKLVGSAQQGLDFFDDMFTTTDTNYVAYLDIIDAQNNYKIYKFYCYITNLTLSSAVGQFANYSYTLQGNGAFTEISEVDTQFCGDSTSGLIFGRQMSTWRLIGVGYKGKWYFNYIVIPIDGLFYIDLGPALNGVKVTTVYIPI